MAQQTINVGSAPNDGSGDPLRDCFEKCNANFDELYGASGGGTSGASTWDFNFATDGYQVIRASEAMTITQQATTGTGTVAYEKSTAAAPDTFASTSSPITLEAGAKLKVTASSVTATYAVHLERTA